MKLRRFISVFLIFYLFLLQAETAFGHTHTSCNKAFTHSKAFISAAEKSNCVACFAATLKPTICTSKAFFLESIYGDFINSYSFTLSPANYSASQNRLSDRAPPMYLS
ncbi:MAG: hypothetical protein ACXWDO_04865 [Bacteroidia bacterium]